MNSQVDRFESQGRAWARGAFSKVEMSRFDSICDLGSAPGGRLPLKGRVAEVLGDESHLTSLARSVLPGAFPVRVLAFDKSAKSNWIVPWHQDRVIAVRERHEMPGYSAWSKKAGQWHVEPPLALLESMLFARVHLDNSDSLNGCLELALGSHLRGRVPADKAEAAASDCEFEPCTARRGDVVFIKALTLHRSGASSLESRRRTLRIDYASSDLPSPLQWDV